MSKVDKAYVLYATSSYISTIEACVQSINTFTNIPVIVYLLNSDEQIDGALTINWKCNIEDVPQKEFIDRKDPNIYKILIQRPEIVKHALLNYANVVCYIDADSVATTHIDDIFDLYPKNAIHPHFTEGVYEYVMIDGKGGPETGTLEANACELFNVNENLRKKYRQTGYFVANQNCIDFLDEWIVMCNHHLVLENPFKYAPFHEETLVNVLLWKNEQYEGLPYIYMNGSLERTIDVLNDKYEWGKMHAEWFKLPNSRKELLFIHGEKNKERMLDVLDVLKSKKLNVLFIAPHLSTGGMPAFLQKTIESVRNNLQISVVEYECYGLDYVVQRNAIKELVDVYTLYENKMELFDIINSVKPDIIHIHEPSERLNREMINELYNPNRAYRIVETCHDVSFNPDEKMFHPDAYAFCTPYHLKTFNNLPSYKEVIQFPIESKSINCEAKTKLGFNLDRINVINVGLWTPGKNQAEGLDIARNHPDIDFHFIGNQAGNFQSYWEPLMRDVPSNVKVWGERADVQLFMQAADIFMFNSIWECNPLVLREAIGHGLPIIARNLPQYEDMFTDYIQPIDTDLYTIKATYTIPDQLDDYRKAYINFYNTVINIPLQKQTIKITQYFVNQPFLEITGQSNSNFKVCFYEENGTLGAEFNIKINHWVRLNREYYTKWRTKIWQDDELIYDYTLNLENKRVFIYIDSESLGDTIAWMPYVLKFKEKHNCHVILATYKNFLFEEVYPEIEFIEPGTVVNNIYAQYNIGWRYDSNKEPELCNTIPLQKAATNILGLEYEELKPRIHYTPKQKYTGKEYIVIATNSTSGCKFWTKEGWQEVINFLSGRGYKVINVSKERNPFKNCIQIDDVSMDNTMFFIKNCKIFIGLSTGLSWLAWALDKKVVMISNFTEASHEFDCIRITDTNLCHGCWNNPNFKFDKGDWNWCPINKNTPRHFECHKGISAKTVIEKIKGIV